ncbi:unnamed protein product [Prunus brigantina]
MTLGWAIGILFPAACEFTQAVGNSLFDQGAGYFGCCGIFPSELSDQKSGVVSLMGLAGPIDQYGKFD